MKRSRLGCLFVFLFMFFISDYSYALLISPYAGYISIHDYAKIGTIADYSSSNGGQHNFTNSSLHRSIYAQAIMNGGRLRVGSRVDAGWLDNAHGNVSIYQYFFGGNYNYSNPISKKLRSHAYWYYDFTLSSPAVFSMDYNNRYRTGIPWSWMIPYRLYIDLRDVNGHWVRVGGADFWKEQNKKYQTLLDNAGRYRISLATYIKGSTLSNNKLYGKRLGDFDWKLEDAPAPVPEPASGLLVLLGLSFIFRNRKKR